ncbi:hypothetical protein BDW22DRAFT_1432927 [Trametopsis cervina]|nr:hypothetical protein BDW22DRAFT_1432927 [Trametopsis cervina]
MVFGFFTKKTQLSDTPTPADIPLPSSPPAPETELPEVRKDVQVNQLRTPSPSIGSASVARGPNSVASLAPTTANNSSYSSTRQLSEPVVLPTPVQTEPPQPALLPTSESITTLVTSIPAKTLHSYVLEQLPSASTTTLESLCAFFNTLTPPPKLHCVRCHKDFTDVENDDRSCLVPHDDESAEVERVGRTGEARKTKEWTEYETLWGCCGKTTEGDGSQGPPEGWCYEGKHTTDIKRARFRADSTPLDDKLTSCLRLNCHGIRARMPRGASTRKRVQKAVYKESDDDDSEGETDSGVEEITGKGKEKARKPTKKKVAAGKAKDKGKAKEGGEHEGEDKMDVDAGDNVSHVGSIGDKAQKIVVQTPTSAPPKRRGRPPKRKTEDQQKEDGTESTGTITPAPKRRGRPPKSKALIDDSDVEANLTRKASASPTRGGGEKSKARSLSRGKAQGSVSKLVAELDARSSSTKRSPRSRLGHAKSDARDDDVEMEDDNPKKKRKVVS